jgi:hypothetical protein
MALVLLLAGLTLLALPRVARRLGRRLQPAEWGQQGHPGRSAVLVALGFWAGEARAVLAMGTAQPDPQSTTVSRK